MVLGAITYLDRVSISVARPDIARDLNLSPTQMGYVFSAFYLAYAAVRDSHRLVGRSVGTRRVLTRIVCWWSAFTVLTGFAFNYSSLRGDPVSVRRRRSRRVAERRPDVLAVVSAAGARHGAGHFFHGRAPRRRADPDAGDGAARLFQDWRSLFVAVRVDRVRLGVGLVPMVSRFAGGASRRRRGRARA